MNIFPKLPSDLQELVLRFEKKNDVSAAYTLLHHATRALNSGTEAAPEEVKVFLMQAHRAWEGIRFLGVHNCILHKACAQHHDIWYQLLQDPYDMSLTLRCLLEYFNCHFEPTLAAIFTISNGSDGDAC